MNDAQGRLSPDPDRAMPRAATAWATVGFVGVIAFGGYLRFVSQGPLGIDEWWHGLAALSRGTAAYAVAVFMAESGSAIGATVMAAIAAALFIALRRPRLSATIATSMLFGVAGSQLLKQLVARPRPWDQLYSASGYSYPSGHTMGAAALAVSLALVIRYSGWVTRQQARWVTAIAVVWILLMAWSRTALHVHWLSDTAAGAAVGASAALVSFAMWRPHQRPDRADVGGSL